MACADSNSLPDLGDRLVDYLDGIRSMAAFVVRSLTEFSAGIQKRLQRSLHVALIRAGRLIEGDPEKGNNEDLTNEPFVHRKIKGQL
jgi:hypothetical protein